MKEIFLDDFDSLTAARFLKMKDSSSKHIYLTIEQLSKHPLLEKPIAPASLNKIYQYLQNGKDMEEIKKLMIIEEQKPKKKPVIS